MPCAHCARKFKTQRGLDAHRKNKHEGVQNTNRCRGVKNVKAIARRSARGHAHGWPKKISIDVVRLERLELAQYEDFYRTYTYVRCQSRAEVTDNQCL